MSVYGFDENRLKKEVLTLDEFKKYSYLKIYTRYDDVPNCKGVTDMRAVAQNMPTPSVLVVYLAGEIFSGVGNGILTIKKNTTTNTAVFVFERVFSPDTYFCHFVADDQTNWSGTKMLWHRVLDSDVLPVCAIVSTAGGQDLTVGGLMSKKIVIENVIPTSNNYPVVLADMHAENSLVRLPVIINISVNTDKNRYEILINNPNESKAEGRISWRVTQNYTTRNGELK